MQCPMAVPSTQGRPRSSACTGCRSAWAHGGYSVRPRLSLHLQAPVSRRRPVQWSGPPIVRRTVGAVQSKPRLPRHGLRPSPVGPAAPCDQVATQSLFFVPSRTISCRFASAKSSVAIMAQQDRTSGAVGSSTRVMRPLFDWRVNSTRSSGPSSNHSRRIGSSRGSQINDPQPKHAIAISLAPVLNAHASVADSNLAYHPVAAAVLLRAAKCYQNSLELR